MDLKEKREQKGYTQQRLADEVGVTQTAISLIESGDRNPSILLAKKIGHVLGFNWTEFYEAPQDYNNQTKGASA